MKINKNFLLKFMKSVADLKFNEVRTDKALLIYDGELEVGTEVLIEVEGDFVAPEDGDYTTEDGKVITVLEGKVSSITEPVEEELEEENPRIAELEALLAEKDEEIAALKQRITELENEKAAPTEEEVEIKASAQSNDNNIFNYFK